MEPAKQLKELKTTVSAVSQSNQQVQAGFSSAEAFELMQRMAKAFASSDLVPQIYRGNFASCMIALDMANRIGAAPLSVMQSMYIVHGTPSWSSKFLIATVNACGRFTSLRYEWKGKPGDPDYGCRAWAIEKSTEERLDGIWVTWQMVKAEGWDTKKDKNGNSISKWKTMPDQMFVYRAAAFWQRAYAPELAMGLSTAEEVMDVYDASKNSDGSYSVDIGMLRESVDTETGEVLNHEEAETVEEQKPTPDPVSTDKKPSAENKQKLDLG